VKNIELLKKVLRRATKKIDECEGKLYEERIEIVGLTTLKNEG